MKKLTREELDSAIDSLRKLRTEKSFTGSLPDCLAMCYSPAPTEYYIWDHLPLKYTCPKCRKNFGSVIEHEYTTTDDPEHLRMISWDFDDIYKAYEKMKDAGYDVELDIYCSKCVEENKIAPLAFRLRVQGAKEYAVSYPVIRSGSHLWSSETEQQPEKHFYSWQYDIVASFLTELTLKEKPDRRGIMRSPPAGSKSARKGDSKSDKQCRDWLKYIRDCDVYYEKPWKMVYEAIEGILGKPIERIDI